MCLTPSKHNRVIDFHWCSRFGYLSTKLIIKTQQRLSAYFLKTEWPTLLYGCPFTVLRIRFFGCLTVVQIWPHSGPQHSCSGRTPSSAPRPLSAALHSHAPGKQLGLWSGSPLTCGHHASAWQPRCSSSSSASTSHPGEMEEKKIAKSNWVKETRHSAFASYCYHISPNLNPGKFVAWPTAKLLWECKQ